LANDAQSASAHSLALERLPFDLCLQVIELFFARSGSPTMDSAKFLGALKIFLLHSNLKTIRPSEL